MTNDNQDALRCAETMERENRHGAAAHLRRLVAENEAKDALLRQAVEALEQATTGWHRVGQPRLSVGMDALPVADAAIAAIRQHLDKKTT